MNIIVVEAKLMAMYIGLIPAMDNKNTCEILIITNAISAVSKILESQINPLQRIILSIADKLKSFLGKNSRNIIYFWQYPKKAEWPRHKLIDDQVKVPSNRPICPSRNSYLFSKKKEYNDILKEWQILFSISQKKGQLFLDFEDKKQYVIKPIYTKEGSWLFSIEFTNALYIQFTHITTDYASISKYH